MKIQPIRRSSRISVKRQILQDQSGFSLIEALVSILLLSIIVIGILTVATSAYKLVRFVDARETAKNYAEWEMEYIQQQPYASSYSPKQNPAYPGYTVSNPVVTSISTGEQIDVTITGNGVTYKLSDYKVNY